LFLSSFLPEELMSCEELRALMLKELCVVTALLDEHGRPSAAAVGEWDPDSKVLLLAYMAVRRDQRSGGLGGRLMAEVSGAWQGRYQPRLTLAEVEHPLAHRADPDRGDGMARLRFYARHGAQVLDVPYFQPSLRPGGKRVYGMLLIALPPLPDREPKGFIDSGPVRGFLTGYFLCCEGAVGTDPASRQLWRAVDHPGGIPLLALDDPAVLPLSTGPG